MTIISQFRGEYRFLSNFWHAPLSWSGDWFPTVEHAYQAAKVADGPGSHPWHAIRLARSPAEAKHLGRTMPFALHHNWDQRKVPVMRQLLARKFALGTVNGKRLLATGDTLIQEGNWWNDRFWGVDAATGIGENQLGLLLMEQRAFLRQLKEDPARRAG